MLDFFDNDEKRRNFVRRLNALSLNTDFVEVMATLKAYRTSVDQLLRYVEDDKKLRQLQGTAQFLTDFIELVEETNSNKL